MSSLSKLAKTKSKLVLQAQIDQLKKDNRWREVEFFKSNYIASKDVNAWLGLYEVMK